MLGTRTLTALALVTATLGTGLAGSPAEAATGYVGRVQARGGLVAHYAPTSPAPRYGSYPDGARIGLVCKVRSVSIHGNKIWYLVRGSANRWVSARYVDNIGSAPRTCGDGVTSDGRVSAARLYRREGPSLRTAKVGHLSRHDLVHVVCWTDGLGEGAGDVMWFLLTNGSWVSADYVDPTKQRVELCR